MENTLGARARGMVAVALLAWSAGCAPEGATAVHPETSEAAASFPLAAVETVRGTLRFFDLEGGFWGIVSDAGERLRVVGPVAPAWRDGVRVVARVRRLPPGPSLHQWGEPIEVEELRIEGDAVERRRE